MVINDQMDHPVHYSAKMYILTSLRGHAPRGQREQGRGITHHSLYLILRKVDFFQLLHIRFRIYRIQFMVQNQMFVEVGVGWVFPG